MILFKMQAEYLFNGTVISELGGGKKLLVIFLGVLILVVVDYLQYNNFDIVKKIFSCHVVIRWGIYLGLLFVIIVFGIYGYSYEQTQFIYFQF